jgi:hypothetical protein
MYAGGLCKTLSPTIGLAGFDTVNVSTNLLTEYSEDSLTLILISGKKSLITATVLSSGAFPARSPFRLL